ncbi:flagellar basal body rod protein FlgB [Periweissella beninensis]|uniref:Flagellar basal body rod protein FlgB n=1 Tax=Periweissella beninensis TaxID=504936 RepID=A0ABT0VIH9_9LACO|nr:flagellar basal body rod protein FlgB [Periweissella beninensis]MBM7544690.1 flagellar basal-body rod protein FlgB [Periweissella beninensis]MCM2436928.1 flagellar basal body rod protein FlgB [Periweissella beninensis]MCT4396315.1 flagellar basal body rod protein FlgB [Periweissella beninensis]
MESYDLIKDALGVANTRAQLISSNIANVNTANYKAKRVEFENYLTNALNGDSLALKKTNTRHLGDGSGVQPQVTTDANTAVKANGNNVDLDVEMVNQATNSLYYNALTSQINGRFQMLNYVLDH